MSIPEQQIHLTSQLYVKVYIYVLTYTAYGLISLIFKNELIGDGHMHQCYGSDYFN